MLRRFDNWMLTGSCIVRRQTLDEAGALDEACGTFADGFLLRKVALTRGFCYAPRPVAGWRIFSSSASRQTALEVDKAVEVLHTVADKIAADPVFPPWYAEVFRARWRFAVSRLALEATPIGHPALDAMAADSALDTRVLEHIRELLRRAPALERMATLAWLTLRLRPFPLWRVLATWLSRWRRAAPA
jgi:hypothetical protein